MAINEDELINEGELMMSGDDEGELMISGVDEGELMMSGDK